MFNVQGFLERDQSAACSNLLLTQIDSRVHQVVKIVMHEDRDVEIFKIQAGICSVFSNEKRLQILWALEDNEYSVGELAKKIGISPVNVSQHLRVMKEKGVLIERKEGQHVYYRIANPKFIKGYKTIKEGIIETLKSRSTLLSKKIR